VGQPNKNQEDQVLGLAKWDKQPKTKRSCPWVGQVGQTTKNQEDKFLGLAKWDNQPKTKGIKSMGYLSETHQTEVEQAKG
jgi:hypothetical protein